MPKKKAYKPKASDFILFGILLAASVVFIAFQNKGVQQNLYITLMLQGPDPKMRGWAAEELQNYPGKASLSALVRFLKQKDYSKQKDEAISGLTSLCLLSGENFGAQFSGTRENNSMGFPEQKEWPYIIANINDWAWQKGLKDAARKPDFNPELEDLLAKLASDDVRVALSAWQELAARYKDSKSYLQDLKRKLAIESPISFAIKREYTKQGTIYNAADPAVEGNAKWKALASTVGEALRYQLWQLDPDKTKEATQLSFRQWWQVYTHENDLPKASEIWTGKDDPEASK